MIYVKYKCLPCRSVLSEMNVCDSICYKYTSCVGDGEDMSRKDFRQGMKQAHIF
uniref:Uncharacterized protein n=1 Tax=Arion vulgaris TaxID=1028688 RepID=A0A0B7AIQ4_9EUPU